MRRSFSVKVQYITPVAVMQERFARGATREQIKAVLHFLAEFSTPKPGKPFRP